MDNQPKENERTSWSNLITDLIFKLLNLLQINQQLNIIRLACPQTSDYTRILHVLWKPPQNARTELY